MKKKVLVVILSLVLVLGIAIPGTLASENLDQPATVCEMAEHTHGESCYTLPEAPNCGIEAGAGAHFHTDGCKKLKKELTCTSTDETHTHGEECYAVKKNLICGLAEDENHSHSDGCYAPVFDITCGMQESAGHTHVESCYTKVLSCGQQEHTHGDTCYAAPPENITPTCTCGSMDENHVEGCALYVAPTCTCGSMDENHVEGCALYVAPPAPTCTCGSADGTHDEGCAL